MYLPGAPITTPVMISPFSVCAIGTELSGMASAAMASAAWPAASRMIAYPFIISNTYVAMKVWWLNGATASGNIDLGIYDEGYNLLASAGSTAQGTTNVVQEVDITDYTLAPGRYYAALVLSSATGRIFRTTGGNNAQFLKSYGMWQQASITPGTLPNPATPAVISTANVPMFGLAGRTLVA